MELLLMTYLFQNEISSTIIAWKTIKSRAGFGGTMGPQ